MPGTGKAPLLLPFGKSTRRGNILLFGAFYDGAETEFEGEE